MNGLRGSMHAEDDSAAARLRLLEQSNLSTSVKLPANHGDPKRQRADPASSQRYEYELLQANLEKFVAAAATTAEATAVTTCERIFPLPFICNATTKSPHVVSVDIVAALAAQMNAMLTSHTHTWQTGKTELTKFDFSSEHATLESLAQALLRCAPPVNNQCYSELRALAAIVSRGILSFDRHFQTLGAGDIALRALKRRALRIVLEGSVHAFEQDMITDVISELTAEVAWYVKPVDLSGGFLQLPTRLNAILSPVYAASRLPFARSRTSCEPRRQTSIR